MTNEEFARLDPRIQQTIRSGLLMEQMLADADTARAVLPLADKMAKKANPSHMTVEEQAEPIVARVRAEFQEELSKRDKKAAEDVARSELQSQIAAAKQNDGFTDEGIGNVLKLMTDKGVADFEIAKNEYQRRNPTPSTSPGTTDRMDWNFFHEINAADAKGFFDGTDAKSPAMVDNPEAWERANALAYLNGRVDLPNS